MAEKPDHKSWSSSTQVDKPGETVTVVIPKLEPTAEPAVVVPPPVPEQPSPTPTPPVPEPPKPDPDKVDEGGVPAWAWVAGGVGLAAAVASGVFLGLNRSVAAELDDQCGGEARDDCPPQDEYDAEGDHDFEKLSSGMFIGFGVAAIVGIGVGITGIVIGTSGGDARLTPIVGPRNAGMMFEGRF